MGRYRVHDIHDYKSPATEPHFEIFEAGIKVLSMPLATVHTNPVTARVFLEAAWEARSDSGLIWDTATDWTHDPAFQLAILDAWADCLLAECKACEWCHGERHADLRGMWMFDGNVEIGWWEYKWAEYADLSERDQAYCEGEWQPRRAGTQRPKIAAVSPQPELFPEATP